jgi:hypothetical protein
MNDPRQTEALNRSITCNLPCYDKMYSGSKMLSVASAGSPEHNGNSPLQQFLHNIRGDCGTGTSRSTQWVTIALIGLARTIYIRCIYGILCRDVIKYTVINGVYIRFWPTLRIRYCLGRKQDLKHDTDGRNDDRCGSMLPHTFYNKTDSNIHYYIPNQHCSGSSSQQRGPFEFTNQFLAWKEKGPSQSPFEVTNYPQTPDPHTNIQLKF